MQLPQALLHNSNNSVGPGMSVVMPQQEQDNLSSNNNGGPRGGPLEQNFIGSTAS